MVNRPLYVFDETSNVKKIVRYCMKNNIKEIFLCPITANQDTISLIVKSLSSSINCKTILTPYLERFNTLSFSERDNFIRFISEFGEKSRFGSENFIRYFKYPHSSFSIWWLSLISEKNPQKSDSYHNLIKLLSILSLIKEYECKRIILDIKSAVLSCTIINNSKALYDCYDFKKYRMRPQIVSLSINFLKAIKYYFYSIYKIFIVTVYTRGLAFRKEILRNAQYIAITYFPLVDKESLKQERFVNKYYGSLQTALENKYKDKFIWLAMVPCIDGFSFKNSIKLGRQLNLWNYSIYFLEEWIGLKDLFITMAYYIYFTMKCIIKLTYLTKKFEYSKKSINVWRIFEEDWFSSFAGSTLISGILYFRAFKNISSKLKMGTVVTYLAENQSWEKALNFTFHDNKNLKSIGLIHSTVPLLFLPFFDFQEQLQKDEQGLAMPRPDHLACNGRIPLTLFQQNGWDEKKSFLWFAMRYQYLKKHLRKEIPWETRQNKILVALLSNIEESRELLCYIHEAFSDQTDYQIVIKGHYVFPVQTLIRHLDLDFNKDTFVFSDKELDKLLPSAKAMVVTGSSIALESIAFGCPVIIPRLFSVIDMNPLSGISDLPVYVNSPKELQVTVEDIVKRRESPLSYEKCKNFIENYFEFPDSENELIEKIESRL